MIVYDYENNSVVERKLTDDNKQSVVDVVVDKWKSWSSGIKGLRERRDTMLKQVSPKICKKDKDDWHSKIELNRPYEFYNKLYGILYETFYDKISSYLKMGKQRFDVVYNKAFNPENKKQLLATFKDFLHSGEIVASAELQRTTTKQVLPIDQIATVDPRNIVSVRKNSFVVRVESEPQLNFIRINPCNFAYDPLVMPGTKEFDTCDKIVKQWLTRRQIISNKKYEISREELEQCFGDNENHPNQQSSEEMDKDSVVRGNQIEVLTYFGSFSVDGHYYEDYVAVVVGRSKLVAFEPKGIFTPGVYYFPFHALKEGDRGTSPLYYIMDLCAAEQKAFNDSIDFIELQKNPPIYAPEGFFEENEVKLAPGAHITYNQGMYDPNSIIKIEFNAQPIQVFQESTKQLEKEVAGIDNGQLSVKSEALTEEEVRRVAISENLIPNMIISGILLNIISKYLKDCVQIVEEQQFDEAVVKTAWEFANEQLQMQNVVSALEKIGASDPTMVNLADSSVKVLQTLGVNPAEYLTDGRQQKILSAFGNLSDEVLQKLTEIGNQLQVEENNQTKAAKMMGQIQDDEYRRQLRDSWKNLGAMPAEVVVPNGPGQNTMNVPVLPVSPGTQTNNRVSTTAD